MQLSTLGLAINPCAKITISGDSEPPLFLVQAPRRGAQLLVHTVGPDDLPQAYGFLAAALLRGESAEQFSESEVAELQEIGLLAPVSDMPTDVQYALARFDQMERNLSGPPGAELATADVIGQLGIRIPPAWLGQPLRFQLHDQASVWVPVLMDSTAMPSTEIPTDLAILDAPATHDQFARQGYAELQNLLPQSQVEELSRYFQALAAEGFLFRDEHMGSRRYVAHNHPIANFWHDQLLERVSQLAGCPTKASYSYVSIYIEGGDLKWHFDRPSCEYTIALLLDYSPLDNDARSCWPLKLKGRDGGIREIHQGIGDALFFKGRELKHSRDALPIGHRSASLLFHFVDANYDGVME